METLNMIKIYLEEAIKEIIKDKEASEEYKKGAYDLAEETIAFLLMLKITGTKTPKDI